MTETRLEEVVTRNSSGFFVTISLRTRRADEVRDLKSALLVTR